MPLKIEDKNILARFFFYLWASPNTLAGLIIASLNPFLKGRNRIVSGVLEVHGPLVRFLLKHTVLLQGQALALALGHVVLGADEKTLDKTREHERIHVRQYERYGPFFIPLYAAAMLVAWIQGKRPYRDNWFEIEAYSNSTID